MFWRPTFILAAILGVAAPAVFAQADPCSYRSIPVSREGGCSSAVPLTPGDFSASIDKKPVTIVSVVPNSAPVRVVIALDASSSMELQVHSWDENLNAAEELLKQLPAGSPVGLVVFADKPQTVLPLSSSRDVVRAQLEQFRPRHERMHATALWDALTTAATLFGAPQPGDTIYLISDGDDDASRGNLYATQTDLWTRGIRLFMLSLGPEMKGESSKMKGREARVLQMIRDSGGSVLRVPEKPKKKSSAQELEAISNIAGSALLAQQFKAISEFDVLRAELPEPVRGAVRWDLTLTQQGGTDPQILFPRAIPACAAAQN